MEQEDNSQQMDSQHTPIPTLTIERLTEVWQVVNMWEFMARTVMADGKGFDAAKLLQQVVHCLKHGGVFVGSIDGKFVGFTVLEKIGVLGVLHIIQGDMGLGLGKLTLNSIKQWSRGAGIRELHITLTTFNGSNYRYIKKSMGFHRHSETFALSI